METTKAQQIALDNALVIPANRLKIGKCNHRLSSTLKSNEPIIQVVLDTLKLTPFYKAFQITANVPEIYMQEFWAIVSIHHKSLCFKMNDKSHTLNLENFRDMLQIFPRLPGQKFEDPLLEEEILSFIRDLGYTKEIKVLTNLCLSRAQIIWGMYHKKNVDYVYLLWEDLDTQIYGSILPDEFINQEIKDSESYKQYYAIESRAEPPKAKTKYKKKANGSDTSSKAKSAPTVKGKRLKTSGDGADTRPEVPDEQQQKDGGTDKGVGDRPEVPDVPEYKSESEEESWTFSQGDDDDDDDNDEHDLNDEKDDADDDDKNDSEETESDDDGDEFVHPNLSTYKADDQEEEKIDDDDEVSFDQ
ncbi:hypothetical protein Tco_1198563, partial [Tanacetum coccineum]